MCNNMKVNEKNTKRKKSLTGLIIPHLEDIYRKCNYIMIYIRNFKTESEFKHAYNGSEYIEPWVSYTKFADGEDASGIYLKHQQSKSFKIPE